MTLTAEVIAPEHPKTRQLPQTFDMRRHRRQSEVDAILAMAQHLKPADRALLESVYQAGQTAAAVARVRKAEPRVVRAQIRRLVARVLAPEFAHVVRRRERWSRVRQQVGRLCFVEGASLRAAARALAISVYAVRRHREWIRAGADELDPSQQAAK
ncbi:MAG: hypothetical protein U0637_11405 [Phycisphaerales bacterium]